MLYDVDGHAAKDTARPWIGQWQTEPSSCVSLSNTKSTSMARSPCLSTLVVQFRQPRPGLPSQSTSYDDHKVTSQVKCSGEEGANSQDKLNPSQSKYKLLDVGCHETIR